LYCTNNKKMQNLDINEIYIIYINLFHYVPQSKCTVLQKLRIRYHLRTSSTPMRRHASKKLSTLRRHLAMVNLFWNPK